MKFTLSSASPLEISTPALLLPIFGSEPLSGAAASLNEKLGGVLTEIIESDGFKAGAGETRVVYASGQGATRIVLLGLGTRERFTSDRFRKAVVSGARAVRALKKTEFAFLLPESDDLESLTTAAAEAIELGLHVFDDFLAGEKFYVESATLIFEGDESAAQKGLELAAATTAANLKCRALVNLPSNLKSPAYFGQVAEEIAAEKGLKVQVWDEKKILEEKMGALYGVGMGSDNQPRFIVLEYVPPGTENDAPIALVGKGMSFDSGGYSIKPSSGMEEMKDDMAGAGVVISAMSALGQLGIKKRVLGVVASAENMISSNAQRPGDIVTARNGTTIEVLNTDAEGRLILADALTWTCEQNPSHIVDFATLTGAIGIALGQEGAGLFSNDDTLSAALSASGDKTGEKIWRFPMWEEYDDYMKGTCSDLKNLGPERRAGSTSAAVFLRHFVTKGTPWAHLDIAAVSHVRDSRLLTQRGATGFGVRLILDWLLQQD